MPSDSVESALAVFAVGVEISLYLAVMGGLLFATLKAIRNALGIGRDV